MGPTALDPLETRVLEVLSHSAGGIAKHVAALQKWLDGTDGLTVDVAAPADLPVRMPRAPISLEIPRGPLGHRVARRDVSRVVHNGHYDVVHAHGLRAAMDAGKACAGTTVLRVATVHNLVRPEISGAVKARAYRRAERIAVRANDRVLAVSEDIARHLRRVSDGGDVEVLHLGVEPPAPPSKDRAGVRRELGVPDGKPLIACVARLDPQKALHVLVDAAVSLREATFVVIGTGPLHDELIARAGDSGVGDRILFLGWRDDVTDVVAAADAFCLSSVWEGVPLAAQEAIALDVPVVATDVGGMRDLIEDGVSGRLVAPGDARGLASALEEVLQEPSRARSFATAAHTHLVAEFSIDVMLSRIKEIYASGR